MHPDTLLACKERVKTVTEFGSIAPVAAGADVTCGWLQPLTKVATISTSVLTFFMRFHHPDLPGASMEPTCLPAGQASQITTGDLDDTPHR